MKRVLAILAMSFAAAACAPTAGVASLDVSLREVAIDLSSGVYEAGEVDLDIRNVGEFPHTLVVEDSAGRVLAATDVIAPGESATLEIELSNEQYRFTCRIVTTLEDGSVFDHFEQGMVAHVRAST